MKLKVQPRLPAPEMEMSVLRLKKQAEDIGKHNINTLVNLFIKTNVQTRNSTKRLYEDQLKIVVRKLLEMDNSYIDIRNINLFTLEELQVHLVEGLADSTVKSYLKTFSRMLKYAEKHGLIESNPFEKFEYIVPKKDIGYVASEAEIRTLVSVLGECITTVEQLRYATAILVILTTANRIGETCQLKWSDIDRRRLEITLRPETTKDGLEHIKPIDQDLLEQIDELKIYAKTEYIFETNRGGYVNPEHVSRFLAKVLEKAGINSPITLHGLRRFVISDYVSKGGSLEIASRILATHSSISTTEKYYLKPNEEKLRESLRANFRKSW